MNKKISIDPQSFGPFRGLLSSFFFQKILDKVDEVHCREKISYRYLQKYFLVKKLELKPDIVFHYKIPQRLSSSKREKIGVTIVSSRLNQNNYLNVLFELIEKTSFYFKTKKFVIIRQVDINQYNQSELIIEKNN